MGDDEREAVIKLTAGRGEGGSEIKSTLAALAARQCNRPELPCQGSSTRFAGGWRVFSTTFWLGLTKIKSYLLHKHQYIFWRHLRGVRWFWNYSSYLRCNCVGT